MLPRVIWVHCKTIGCCSASCARQPGKTWQQIQEVSGEMFSTVAGKAPALAKAPQQPHWAVSVHFLSPAFQEDLNRQMGKGLLGNKRWFSLFLKDRLNSLSCVAVLTEDWKGLDYIWAINTGRKRNYFCSDKSCYKIEQVYSDRERIWVGKKIFNFKK